MTKCSIGIMAYNEEKNIGKLLLSVQNQKLSTVSIDEITVVASGCADKTAMIVKDFQEKDPRIILIEQEKREGKSSAVNLWLKSAKNEILVLESADTLPDEEALEKLVSPFENNEVGMAGARPCPVDNSLTFMGFTNHLMWNLHHLLSLKTPKMGEMIAFRKVFEEIPKDSAVDEASIESIIGKLGYKIIYAPEAIVKNKGPETIRDFLKQRRRIYCGHLELKKEGHEVSTISGIRIFPILIKNTPLDFKSIIYTPLAICLEMYGRFLGWYDFKIKKKDHSVWEIAESTKKL